MFNIANPPEQPKTVEQQIAEQEAETARLLEQAGYDAA